MDEDDREWLGVVMLSPLDNRVWVAVLPDVDMHSGALHASTSIRKCKRYVEEALSRDGFTNIRWIQRDNSDWEAHADE